MDWNRVLDALVLPFAKLLEPRESEWPGRVVDIAVGFGIGMRPGGDPSLLSSGVALRCVELFKAGLASTIVFTGGTSENGVSEAAAMKNVAVRGGVPEEQILIEEFSRNTRQNALNVLALIRRDLFKADVPVKVATVGQHLHARRCYNAFRRVAPKKWTVIGKKAYCPYDPQSTQWRLGSEWRFFPWELAWNMLFKILRWA